MHEIWKDVVGLEGIYEVSNMGQVRRIGKSRGARVGHSLTPTQGGEGGKYLKLVFGRRGIKDYVHRIVARAFWGAPPSSRHEVNHKNGDTKDNRAENLEWVTRSENNMHSYRMLGRTASVPIGEKQWNSKLTEADVRDIRDLWATGGYTQSQLASQFGVLQTTVSRLVLRQSWKHI